MAKEDILLREEMGRLEIEPIKINRNRSDENPFLLHSKRGIYKKTSAWKSLCSCNIQMRNSGVFKRKHNKILKEPMLKILKTCKSRNAVEREEFEPKADGSAPLNLNADTLSLCTLVKNCNQLKISCGTNEQLTAKTINDDTKWWKNEVVCSRESKDLRHSNQAGSCSQQALNPPCDVTIDELASYFETLVHIPKKMSSMAEMMYI